MYNKKKKCFIYNIELILIPSIIGTDNIQNSLQPKPIHSVDGKYL